MRGPWTPWLKSLFGAAALTLAAGPALAQSWTYAPAPVCPTPLPYQPSAPVYQGQPAAPPGQPVAPPGQAPTPAPALPSPQTPAVTPSPAAPPTATPSPAAPPATPPAPAPTDLAFAAPASGAGFGETASIPAQGYIDSAVPLTQFRLRYDSSYGLNRPDRAEFFYPKCGCFRFAPPPFFDPNAPGPGVRPETNVDYQEVRAYFEWAANPRFSAFLEAPVRSFNGEQNDNTTGFSDMFVGFKYALVAERCRYVTFQFLTALPTGDADRGLGTDHVSVEPGLLVYNQVNQNLSVFGELRDWIPIDGTEFAGNVLRYGIGAGYTFHGNDDRYITPVVELVGWTVLSGKESSVDVPIESAVGDTIVNAKIGARVGRGANSLYLGYGRALTGEVWYRDTFRLEFRRTF